MTNPTYSSRSTAVRGVKRAGLDPDTLEFVQDDEGRWTYAVAEQVATIDSDPVDEQDDTPNNDPVEEEADVPAPVEGEGEDRATEAAPTEAKGESGNSRTYKELSSATAQRSALLKPVDYIHKFLSENPQLSRKEAITALVDAGINFSTARTQYQRWYTKRKA